MRKVYNICLLQILSFSTRFRQFEMIIFLRWPTMVAFIIVSPPLPQKFFHFYGPVTFKKFRSSHRRCSIKKLLLRSQKIDRKAPLSESLFNSEDCEIFKSTYFEEHLRTAASENVFMKQRKNKDCSQGIFNFILKKQNVCFHFMK